MTQILTFRYSTNTENDMGLISLVQTTAAANVYANSDVDDDYSDDAVKRILSAKDAKAVSAPEDAAEFMSWLTA